MLLEADVRIVGLRVNSGTGGGRWNSRRTQLHVVLEVEVLAVTESGSQLAVPERYFGARAAGGENVPAPRCGLPFAWQAESNPHVTHCTAPPTGRAP